MKINIVCAIDDQYTQHCGVMLTSLFENNKTVTFHVYVLSEYISKQNIVMLEDVSTKYSNSMEIKLIDKSYLEVAPVFGHITLSTYYRLLIPFYVPESVSKIIYLDSDIIVRDSIVGLWQIELKNNILAASPEPLDLEHKVKLNLNEKDLYFNAGVLLINLEEWRKVDYSNKALTYLKNNASHLKCWDQDVLNATTQGQVLFIEPYWNASEYIFKEPEKVDFLPIDEINRIALNPKIVHFTGGGYNKPWYYQNKHIYKFEYYKYLRITPWKNFKPIGEPTFSTKLKGLVKKIIYKFFNGKPHNLIGKIKF